MRYVLKLYSTFALLKLKVIAKVKILHKQTVVLRKSCKNFKQIILT